MKKNWLKQSLKEVADLSSVYNAIKGIEKITCEVCNGTGKEAKSSIEYDSYGPFYSPGRYCRYCHNGQRNVKIAKKQRIEILEDFIRKIRDE